MRVCLDATIAATGIGAYASGLATALQEVPGLDVTVLGPADGRGVVSRLAWRERHLRRALAEARADVLVVANPELPLRRVPVPSVVVVHDVFPLTVPDLTSRGQQLRFRFLLPRVLSRATRVVCVSEATRTALQDTIAVDPARLAVIGEGPSRFPVLPRAPDRGDPYLLFVGELFPRKNIDTLLTALEGASIRLLIAGPGQPGAMGDRAEHLGYVSGHRLAELYAGASVLVMPSLAEGFGRPVLDAMVRGVPVVASDIPAIRELTGGSAAHLVGDPLDPAQWRAALATVLGDDALREELSARGRARATAYAWTTVAAQWRDLLRELAPV